MALENKGLLFEESLLFQQSRDGACGVDLPELRGKRLRIGKQERQFIGLPKVTEPEVVQHFVRLSQKNYAIDTGFYPLGSCTMKHNPRLNEHIARYKGFSDIHPLQADEQVQGALHVIYEVQRWLGELTGLKNVTLNPAAGAQGEMAGMMAIRKAHQEKRENRTIVLIPDSAHGTNPATARACGYETRTIATKGGETDICALEAAMSEDVAAIMLTNPNTCGLFESEVNKIAELIHHYGAYFYCDGANFNALVGKIKPADFGVDVMHVNLHKTFSTPHGGGGPGSGPIAVSDALAPYLPIPRIIKDDEGIYHRSYPESSIGRIKAFQGQFAIALRAYSYMLSHGIDGLSKVAEDAVLNANYILHHLRDDYHLPFDKTCMHECLFTDKFQQEYKVATYDIAKALIEYGIHPMTIHFPLIVQGAMLIEPTETETKQAIDNFIKVMKHIATLAKEKPEELKAFPQSTPRKRLDEVSAARKPVLTYNDTV